MQPTSQSLDKDIESFFNFVNFSRPYLLRLGRAIAHGVAAYMLLWLQPHFSFSFVALAIAVFFLSLPKRTLPVAEIVLLIVTASIFIPVGFSQLLMQ
jgi:uncharacterized membrane protein YoaK (UPF0700 family)